MTKSRSQKVREARERQRRRQRQQLIVVAIVIVAVVIGLLLIQRAQPAEAPIPEESLTRYEGIQRGTDNNGFPRLGDPDAPVSVVEYSSFSCPSCRVVHDEVFPGILDRVRDGRVSFTYIPLNTAGNNIENANRVALCSLEQGAFWEIHDALFHWFGIYGNNNPFSQNRMLAGVEALGLDRDQFNDCVGSAGVAETLNRAQSQSLAQDVQGTPTMFVNGTLVEDLSESSVIGAIDAAYNLAAPDIEVTPEEAEPTPEEAEPTPEEAEPTPEEAEPTPEEAEPTPEEAEPTPESTEESTTESTGQGS